jgi:hypothetical protein
MTSASAPFAQGKNPRFDLIATRLAHWTPASFVIIAVIFTLGPALFPPQMGLIWPSVLIAIPAAVLFVLTAAVHSWHVYALCPVCARKTPLDPQKAIAAKRRRLRSLHWLADRPKFTKWAMIILLVLSFVLYANLIAFPVLMLWFTYTLYVGNIHMRLQPWCPQCRGGWGKGGEHEVVPTPDPVGENVRTS